MPQMAPINWLFLFIIFCFTYLIFNILNYYIYLPVFKTTSTTSFKKMNLNWKW